MYYCAYARMGTKWIGWFIYVSPIFTLVNFAKDFPDGYIEWTFQLAWFAVYIYFWVNSTALHKLNHIIKNRKMKEGEIDLLENPVEVLS